MNVFDGFSIALLLGSLLLMAEVFFPSGGALGFFSAAAFLGAVYCAYSSGGLMQGMWFAAGEVVLAPFLLYGAFKALPHTPMGKVLIGAAPTEEEVLPEKEHEGLLGRVGVARSKMLPAGSIEIEGRVIDAVSQGQAIEPGEYIKVVEVRGNRVVVRRAPTDERPTDAKPDDLLARPADEIGLEDFDFDSGPS